MAVSANANAPGYAASQNLNQIQEAEPAPAVVTDFDETLDGLVDELTALLGDVVELAKEVKKHSDQA
ncbi:hypothetical protein J3459_018155 [Metarhizium acridum]|uniref:uncharacterized protein n=1 Tax=Metarhizium acridum TaxID=92637 RepID=UPI001C6B32A1|nr:hypothetical protein J3459_018155 [Metarhizium acridum]KAG8413057.1 hypothetical protein J3458_013476 [Metarhizium acridum]